VPQNRYTLAKKKKKTHVVIEQVWNILEQDLFPFVYFSHLWNSLFLKVKDTEAKSSCI
jgi:hypothetical protein